MRPAMSLSTNSFMYVLLCTDTGGNITSKSIFLVDGAYGHRRHRNMWQLSLCVCVCTCACFGKRSNGACPPGKLAASAPDRLRSGNGASLEELCYGRTIVLEKAGF